MLSWSTDVSIHPTLNCYAKVYSECDGLVELQETYDLHD